MSAVDDARVRNIVGVKLNGGAGSTGTVNQPFQDGLVAFVEVIDVFGNRSQVTRSRTITATLTIDQVTLHPNAIVWRRIGGHVTIEARGTTGIRPREITRSRVDQLTPSPIRVDERPKPISSSTGNIGTVSLAGLIGPTIDITGVGDIIRIATVPAIDSSKDRSNRQ